MSNLHFFVLVSALICILSFYTNRQKNVYKKISEGVDVEKNGGRDRNSGMVGKMER
jgi:hypothetical protein